MIPIPAHWITDHKLHRPENSGFLALATEKQWYFKLWAEPIILNGEIVSVAIFEEYPDTATYWGSFTCHRQRFLMKCHGRIGLFTKPEHRGNGYAQTAVNQILAEIGQRAIPNTINLIVGAHSITHRFKKLEWPAWAAVKAPIGRNLWEDVLRREIRRHKKPPHVTTKTAIEVLKSKGYIEKEIDGKIRIHHQTTHPDHGKLSRTETMTVRKKPQNETHS